MNANNINILLRNNTGNIEKSSLIEGFVIRTKMFNDIFTEIQNSSSDKPEQSYLVIGQRGAGKTTLLYRLKYAIEDDKTLNKWLVPIMFSEEQYNIIALENFWESIAEYLEDFYDWEGIVKELNGKSKSGDYYEEVIYDVLDKWLKKYDKRIIVFVENINIFFKKIGDSGQKRLREVLTTSPYIRLVGSSTTFFDGVIDYSKPFYDFFKIVRLEGLSKEETETLLLKIGSQYHHKIEIEKIVKFNPKRVESLRRLTGGVPRTISYLFQIFLDNEDGKAIKDLYQLLDHLTLLYKSELDQLSPQQQKIVDIIARKWDPITVKEISLKTRLDSKHISSILKQLEKNQIIEIIPTKTKNHLYRIRERFLNIWYLMRFGKKTDKEKVLWLVRFFDVWCDKTELAKRISAYIDNLKTGLYDEMAAFDMGMTFLSCENVPDDLKFNLYETTKSVLSKKLVESLTLPDAQIYNMIRAVVKKGDFEKAFDILEQISDKQDRSYYLFISWLYYKKKEYAKSSEYLETSYEEHHDSESAMHVGRINENFIKNYEKSIKYYKYALENREYEAAHRLGHIYFEHFDDILNSRKYYELAIDNGVDKANLCLAKALTKARMENKAILFYERAVAKNVKGALNAIGIFYMNQNEFEEAEANFKKALDRGDQNALLNLGILYMSKPESNPEVAREYFKSAIDKGLVGGYYLLGKLLLEEGKNEEEGLDLLNIAVEKGSEEAMHILGHYFDDKGNYELSDKHFLRAFKKGIDYSLLCFFSCAFAAKRNDKKEFLLELFQNNLDTLEALKPTGIVEYSQLLLWNDRIKDSTHNLEMNLGQLKDVIKQGDERSNKNLIAELTEYFILLISKDQYKAVDSFFQRTEPIEFKDLLKPVYYAFMNYDKNESKSNALKISDELRETVEEILNEIENYKMNYK